MYLDLLIITGLVAAFIVSYKCWKEYKKSIKDILLDIAEDDLLCIKTAGAYGFVMSSNYNSRLRSAEVLVDGKTFNLIRRRENIQDLIGMETIPND